MIWQKTRRTALPFRIFHRVLWLVLFSNALAVYFASHSIRAVVVTTVAWLLLLQVAYFASVLFLIWRCGWASRAGKRAEHFGRCRKLDASRWTIMRWR
ncbi:exopolysaccharide production repressor protein [Mesorhizobium sp. M0306]|uniref:exopolysaccharide production repressor protein n=1 Tax=Mesorhizobium sp. M0306 TaxID=2956932 RepID=UPI00333C13C7